MAGDKLVTHHVHFSFSSHTSMLSIQDLLNPITEAHVPQPPVVYDRNYLETLGMPNRYDPLGQYNRQFVARRLPQEENPVERARYDAAFQQQANRWENRLSEDQVIQQIMSLPVGYRTTFNIRGYTLGHICRILTNIYGRKVLKGLFFTGRAYDFKCNVENGDPQRVHGTSTQEDRWFTPKFVSRSVDTVFIHYFPLSKVEFLTPYLPTDSWEDYYNEVAQVEGGSDMACFTAWEDCFISRMAPPARNVMTKIHNTRTAGLGNVITRTIHDKITISAFTIDGEETTHEFHIFVPRGNSNCVQEAYIHLLKYHYIDGHLGKGREGRGWTFEMWEAWANEVFRSLAEQGGKRKKNKVKKMGFTTRDLRLLADSSRSMGIVPHLYYECDEDSWGDRLGKSGSGKIRNSSETEDYTGHFCILQMNECGYIYSNLIHFYLSKEANDDSTASNLLHSIAVYPHPSRHLFRSRDFRDTFRRKIEEITSRKMIEFFTEMKGELYSDLPSLVFYQLTRYQQDLTKTLIFREKKHDQSEAVKRHRDKQQRQAAANATANLPEPSPETIIYAYDLETVTNSNECQHMVWEPFRKAIVPNAEPLESQIPFSAQWCAVNVTDSGNFAQRKMNQGITINEYESDLSEDLLVRGPKGENLRVCDYLLNEPTTEYGGQQLGKCIEDMLRNMAVDVIARGGKYAVAYAHNGAGFDAYVCLQFCRFKVERILKTRRGVMSVTFMVPITDMEGGLEVPIALRDTRLHVSGSLAALCKGFGVPPEWCKLDFPIDKVNYRNCYHPEILKICGPYGINDIKALAFIIVKINQLIGNSRWEPCDIYHNRPPIAQFLTCMSMVRASTRNHFLLHAKVPLDQLPRAIDVPALRIWLEKATIGGRVNAYAKTFISDLFPAIYDAYMGESIEELQSLHQQLLAQKACMVVEDETSLYPATLAKCPMPTGRLFFINKDAALRYINEMHCPDCDAGFRLCERHDLQREEEAKEKDIWQVNRVFCVIRVTNLRWTPFAKAFNLRVLCARRLSSAIPTAGLEYTLETNEEMAQRYGREKVIPDIQAYSNIDLYWMRRSGMIFDIIDGFAFEVSNVYSSFIGPAFQERIQAKREGNKLLSDFLKLNYNGSFGVTAQQNIDSSTSLITLPENLRNIHPSDPEVIRYIMHQHSTELGADEEIGDDSYNLPSGQTLLSKKKKSHIAEYYMEQSPVQIGCAILAYARHIVNLVMFNLPEDAQTYTDTDSIAMDEACRLRLEQAGIIDNSDSAPLGTLKNDHQDGNGQDPRVILSLIGTKKVKMHMTLNEKGELRIYNTFKGLNPSDKNEDGEKMTGNWVEYQIAHALNEISEVGACTPLKVSQWRKSVAFGVKIGEHQQEMKSETYLAHAQSILPIIKPKQGYYEFFIPHGSTMRIGGENHHYPILPVEGAPKEYQIGNKEVRKRNFEKYGADWKKLDLLFQKYYGINTSNNCCQYDTVHRMESKEYDSILSVFESLSF